MSKTKIKTEPEQPTIVALEQLTIQQIRDELARRVSVQNRAINEVNEKLKKVVLDNVDLLLSIQTKHSGRCSDLSQHPVCPDDVRAGDSFCVRCQLLQMKYANWNEGWVVNICLEPCPDLPVNITTVDLKDLL